MARDHEDDERRGLVVVGVAGSDAAGTRIALLAQEGEYEVVVATRVAGTKAAVLPAALDDVALDALFDEARHGPGVDAFEATEHLTHEPFDGWLSRHGVTALDVVGITTDDGVLAIALHAARAGFAVRVPQESVAAASADATLDAVEHLRAAGVEVVAGLGDV